MSEQIPSTHPPTEFINSVTAEMNPLSSGVIRAIYLAQHLGQADAGLTDYIAGAGVAGELGFWLPDEKKQYPSVKREVDRFFEADGAARVAEASLSDAKGDTEVVRGIRADFMQRSWEVFVSNRPSEQELDETEAFHQRLSKQSQGISSPQDPNKSFLDTCRSVNDSVHYVKYQRQMLRRFISLDTKSIVEGGNLATPPDQAYESIVRESMLKGTPTGSAMMNLIMSRLRDMAAHGLVRPELRRLAKTWKQHSGAPEQEQFLPKEFFDAKARLSPAESYYYKIFFRAWGFFTPDYSSEDKSGPSPLS